MNTQIILTVIGSDRPGLTQTLAHAIAEQGGNWLESHLARLGGKYVGSVLVEVDADRLASLEAAIMAIDASGLRVSLVPAGDPSAKKGERLSFELVGQDRPGIVSEVTAVLAGLDVNIDSFASHTENSAWSGGRLFKAEAQLTLPTALRANQVRDALEAISGEIMVDFSIGTSG